MSRPVEAYVDPRSDDVVRIDLSRSTPSPPLPPESERLRRVRVLSAPLSRFWGTDVFLEATIRLPAGWTETGSDRFPVVVRVAPSGSTATAPFDGTSPPPGGVSRAVPAGVIVADLTHRSPFGGPWQILGSPTLGPWDEAVATELLPEIEARFRGRGLPQGRALMGSFRGGWQALAAWLTRPEVYGSVRAVCPGPLGFDDLWGIDLYNDGNAFSYAREWGETPRPGAQAVPGSPAATMEQENRLEAALASRGRSGHLWDALESAFSPPGADGYPTPVWDPVTGEIAPDVVAAWRAFDLIRLAGAVGPRPAFGGDVRIVIGAEESARDRARIERLAALIGGGEAAGIVARGGLRDCAGGAGFVDGSDLEEVERQVLDELGAHLRSAG